MGETRVLLIGPRGAGKTAAGRLLAERLGVPFLDADAEVERETGETVARLLERGLFRRAERRTLARLLQRPRGVLAAGGGAVLWEGLREAARGWIVVWLDAPASELARRIREDRAGARPSLTGRPPDEEIAAVRRERDPLYAACAHLRVETGGHTPQEVAAEIERRLR